MSVGTRLFQSAAVRSSAAFSTAVVGSSAAIDLRHSIDVSKATTIELLDHLRHIGSRDPGNYNDVFEKLLERTNELNGKQLSMFAFSTYRADHSDASLTLFRLLPHLAANIADMRLSDVANMMQACGKWNLVNDALTDAIINHMLTAPSAGNDIPYCVSSIISIFSRLRVVLSEEQKERLSLAIFKLAIESSQPGVCKQWKPTSVTTLLMGLSKLKDPSFDQITFPSFQAVRQACFPSIDDDQHPTLVLARAAFEADKPLLDASLRVVCERIMELPAANDVYSASVVNFLTKLGVFHGPVFEKLASTMLHGAVSSQAAQQFLSVLHVAREHPTIKRVLEENPQLITNLVSSVAKGASDLQCMSTLSTVGAMSLPLNAKLQQRLTRGVLNFPVGLKKQAVKFNFRPTWGEEPEKADRSKNAQLARVFPTVPEGLLDERILSDTARRELSLAVSYLPGFYDLRQMSVMIENTVRSESLSDAALTLFISSLRAVTTTHTLLGSSAVSVLVGLSKVRVLDFELPPEVRSTEFLSYCREPVKDIPDFRAAEEGDALSLLKDLLVAPSLDDAVTRFKAAPPDLQSQLLDAPGGLPAQLWNESFRTGRIASLVQNIASTHQAFLLTSRVRVDLLSMVRMMDVAGILDTASEQAAAGFVSPHGHHRSFAQVHTASPAERAHLASLAAMNGTFEGVGLYPAAIPGAGWGAQWRLSHAPFAYSRRPKGTPVDALEAADVPSLPVSCIDPGVPPSALPSPRSAAELKDDMWNALLSQDPVKAHKAAQASRLANMPLGLRTAALSEGSEQLQDNGSVMLRDISSRIAPSSLPMSESESAKEAPSLMQLFEARAADIMSKMLDPIKPSVAQAGPEGLSESELDDILSALKASGAGSVVELSNGGALYVDAAVPGGMNVDLLVLGPNHRQPHRELGFGV